MKVTRAGPPPASPQSVTVDTKYHWSNHQILGVTPVMANKNIPSKTKTAHFQMGDVVQHVHQHTPDPRDLDYRAQAFSFALTVHRDMIYSTDQLISTAAQIEAYLRGEETSTDGQA